MLLFQNVLNSKCTFYAFLLLDLLQKIKIKHASPPCTAYVCTCRMLAGLLQTTSSSAGKIVEFIQPLEEDGLMFMCNKTSGQASGRSAGTETRLICSLNNRSKFHGTQLPPWEEVVYRAPAHWSACAHPQTSTVLVSHSRGTSLTSSFLPPNQQSRERLSLMGHKCCEIRETTQH